MSDPFSDAPEVQDSAQDYSSFKQEIAEEQAGKSYNQIKEELAQKYKAIVELDNIPGQAHRWIDRGAKLTCEGGDHPYHETWKR